MKSFFRSRLPQRLTLSQVTSLSRQSSLSPGEIEKWYERFILCYTDGYVTYQDFLIHIKQLNIYHGNQQNQLSISMIKQLYSNLDVDKDKQLNFEEFFRFNILINQGSTEDKLKFILNLYDRQKQVYYTQQEISILLTNMFYLLNIPKSSNNLSERLDKILSYISLNNQTKKISWNIFCMSVRNCSTLQEILLLNNSDNES